MLMNNSNDTIGNRTRDPTARSAVPRPTAPRDSVRAAEIHAARLLYVCIRRVTKPALFAVWTNDLFNMFGCGRC
jgi:hypothetical protein